MFVVDVVLVTRRVVHGLAESRCSTLADGNVRRSSTGQKRREIDGLTQTTVHHRSLYLVYLHDLVANSNGRLNRRRECER